MNTSSFLPSRARSIRAERYAAAAVRAFHRYATWLVGISWWRFWLLSILLLALAGLMSELPPFTWKRTETVVESSSGGGRDIPTQGKPDRDGDGPGVNITIGGKRIRIVQDPARPIDGAAGGASSGGAAARMADQAELPAVPPVAPPVAPPAAPPSAPNAPALPSGSATLPSPAAATPTPTAPPPLPGERELQRQITITLPPGPESDDVRRAVEQAKQEIADAIREARGDDGSTPVRVRTTRTSVGEALPEAALFWIIASMIVKITYKGRLRAEAQAAVASETAEAETLKRQVVEARMAAMQAQVEPHFLFNTLASIDHLIETDPKRASTMQKDLIALLRASMPTMREGAVTGLRDLGGELAVVRPYLEILKVRMDERLRASVHVPEGLKSAAFPPMMLQSLVENAVKHGLEPKPEGGELHVKAEVVDGALVVSVRDTGLGFGGATKATQGTGVGLANIRERLQLLYGKDARLEISANTPSGTIASVTVPYRSIATASGATHA